MPLRDHFRPPASRRDWEEVCAVWPGVVTFQLNAQLPQEYRGGPRVTTGIDISERGEQPAFEVLVYDETRARRLVAAVEIVSPRNKDRADARDAFVSKCHALLQQSVCVCIVDPVTERGANLYSELAARLGAEPPLTATGTTYAASLRTAAARGKWRVEAWAHDLTVGAALPTLPLWIDERRWVALELEATYEDTCRGLRIA